MRMATERSNNTDFDHACLNPHFYLRPSHIHVHVHKYMYMNDIIFTHTGLAPDVHNIHVH